MQIEGVCAVVPTPFKAGGDVDHDSLGRVVDLLIASGAHSLTALGTGAEVSRLSEQERLDVVGTIVARARGRRPVVVGASYDGLRLAVEFSRAMKGMGVTAVMVAPPRLAKFQSEAVVNFYKALAEAVDLPIVIQDYPPVCGFGLEAALLARIVREVPAARTIKLDDPPTPFKTSRILAASGATKVSILGGLGGLFFLEELLAGACGVMTGFSYPEVLVRVLDDHRGGRLDEAADLFYRFLPLMRLETQDGIGLAIRKELFRRRGALADGSTRNPGPILDDGTRAALERLIAWIARDPRAAGILA